MTSTESLRGTALAQAGQIVTDIIYFYDVATVQQALLQLFIGYVRQPVVIDQEERLEIALNFELLHQHLSQLKELQNSVNQQNKSV